MRPKAEAWGYLEAKRWGKGKGKSKSKSKGKARAKAKAKANTGVLRCAQDDGEKRATATAVEGGAGGVGVESR